MIFVFGSNTAGLHGAGAARVARNEHGAKLGVGEGLSKNSYALPTKDANIKSLSLEKVKVHVKTFIWFATEHPDLEFQVTRIGCGLAGFKDEAIAPLFFSAPENCFFDLAWKQWLPNAKFWGSYL